MTTRVTGQISSVPVNVSEWKFPNGIVLADPNFIEPRDVHLLISTELFFEILKQTRIKLSEKLPALYETQFGWVIAGAYDESGDDAAND